MCPRRIEASCKSSLFSITCVDPKPLGDLPDLRGGMSQGDVSTGGVEVADLRNKNSNWMYTDPNREAQIQLREA